MARKPSTKSKPKHQTNGTISGNSLCAATGLTDQRHRQLAQQGYFPQPINGKYQTVKTFSGIIRNLREMLRKKDDTLGREQTALTKARRERAEEELAVLRDEYVKKSVIGPALRNISLHQRATLQRKFEQELGPKLDGLTTLERMPLIKTAIDEVCAVFQEGTASWMSEDPKDECQPQQNS